MRHGFRVFIFSVLCTLGVVAGTNLMVDPFGLFGTPRLVGFNKNKILEFEHDRISRMVALRANPPDCLLVGSSRVAVGFDTDTDALRDCASPYNAGLAGATMQEVESILELASERKPPRRVMIALDLFMFNATRKSIADFGALSISREDRGWFRDARSAIDLDTFEASVETVLHQDDGAPFAADGALRDEMFGATFRRMRDAHALFIRGIEGYIEHNLPPPNYRFSYRDGDRDSLASLRRVLARRYADAGTETVVIFSPSHAWQWQLLRTIGLESQWLDFKRQTAAILLEEAARSSKVPFRLYDFARFDLVQSSAVPPLGVRDVRVAGYWDPSHFDKQVGRQVLAGIFSPTGNEVSGLGPRLETRNIEAYLGSLPENGRRWREAHAEEVAEIRAIVGCFAATPLIRRLGLPRESEDRCRAFRLLTR